MMNRLFYLFISLQFGTIHLEPAQEWLGSGKTKKLGSYTSLSKSEVVGLRDFLSEIPSCLHTFLYVARGLTTRPPT